MNQLKLKSFLMFCGASLAGACGISTSEIEDRPVADRGEMSQKETWSSRDNPSLFAGNLEMNLEALPMAGEATNVPWAGSYWPTYQDSINHVWGGTDSPALKYEKAFGGTGVEDKVSRMRGIDSAKSQKECSDGSECTSEHGEQLTCAKRRGQDKGRCIPTWWGICHAWTPAAILFPEPKNPVVRNGVTFEVPDLKALASLVHDRASTKFVSLRCEKNNSAPDAGGVRLDEYGRPSNDNPECRDTNAGTYHVLLANYLGKMKQSFAEDRTYNYEVWNQPLRGYRVLEKRMVTADEANGLVGVTAQTDGGYVFNHQARQFVYLRTAVTYIGESDSHTGYVGPNIDRYTHTDYYEYVLELNAAGKIIGGEWVGSSKQAHPDFLWLPTGPGAQTVAEGAISYQTVKAMVMESASQGTVDPGPGNTGVVVHTENSSVAAGEWKQFGPYPTSAGAFKVTLSGTGDADLHTRLGSTPTEALFDCRPYEDDANEVCTGQGPGGLYVAVQGYTASTFSLRVEYVGGSGGGNSGTGARDAGSFDAGWNGGASDAGSVNNGGGTTSHLNVSGTVTQGQMKVFALSVRAGQRVVARTTGTGDVDLYVRFGSAPTDTTYNAASEGDASNEQAAYSAPQAGMLYIGVYGYVASSSFTLTTADN